MTLNAVMKGRVGNSAEAGIDKLAPQLVQQENCSITE